MAILNLTKPINNYKQVDISIKYSLGGISYFDYKEHTRGYYIHFSPCNQKQYNNGICCTEYQPLHEKSFKVLIKETKRKNNTTFKQLLTIMNNNIDKLLEKYEESNQDCYYFIKTLYNLGD